MALILRTAADGTPEIRILGRFDFTANREFRDVCREVAEAPRCTIDMSDTTYVDSSALGMMLLLKEQVPNIRITHANSQVRKVFEIANFQSLFVMD